MNPPWNLAVLNPKIENEIKLIDWWMLKYILGDLLKQPQTCKVDDGKHFEYLLRFFCSFIVKYTFLFAFLKFLDFFFSTLRSLKTKKKRCCEGGPWRPYKLRLFCPLFTSLFHEHSHRVFSVLLYAILGSCDNNFAGRLFINPEFCQCPLRRSYQLHLFWYLQQTCALLLHQAGYCTCNVMVFKCTRYTTCITLNVSQTGCTVASKLGFEPGLLVWRAGSLSIRSSEPATFV